MVVDEECSKDILLLNKIRNRLVVLEDKIKRIGIHSCSNDKAKCEVKDG